MVQTIQNDQNMIYQHNRDIIGQTFGSGHGMGAVYINPKTVPEGFRIMVESTPHHAYDHVVYGRRADGQYIGIGQPYPRSADTITEINIYCKAIGLEMTIGAGSTWSLETFRIVFQRDDGNLERFNIAINIAHWHRDCPSVGHPQQVVDGVNRRIRQKNMVQCDE